MNTDTAVLQQWILKTNWKSFQQFRGNEMSQADRPDE